MSEERDFSKDVRDSILPDLHNMLKKEEQHITWLYRQRRRAKWLWFWPQSTFLLAMIDEMIDDTSHRIRCIYLNIKGYEDFIKGK